MKVVKKGAGFRWRHEVKRSRNWEMQGVNIKRWGAEGSWELMNEGYRDAWGYVVLWSFGNRTIHHITIFKSCLTSS